MSNTSKKRKINEGSSNSTFVWARDGNHESAKEHAAYLLQSSDVPSSQFILDHGSGGDEYAYVRWCSTGTISRIPKANISTDGLSSRRFGRNAASQRAPKRKSRLSLSKKQRQHWRDQQQSGRSNEQDEAGNAGKNNPSQEHNTIVSKNRLINFEYDAANNDIELGPPTVSIDNNDDSGEEKQEEFSAREKSKSISRTYGALVTESSSIEMETTPQPKQIEDAKKEAENMQSKKSEPSDTMHQDDQPQQPATTPEQSYTYRSSAYVQHIAEACNIIMSDARWRTLKQSKETALFTWEEGDDLSAVKAFISLYEEKTNEDMEDNVDNEVFERSMNLYSRIYHRKGPWFDVCDLFVRYYAPKAGGEKFLSYQATLRNLFDDIVRLNLMGLIRSFDSEYECGSIAGKMKTSQSGSGGVKRGVLLSAEERREVLRMLGGGKSQQKASTATSNDVLSQMQSQKTLFFAFASSKNQKTSLLPVRKHVDKVLLRKLATKVASLSKSIDGEMYTPKKAEVDTVLKMIESEWNDANSDVAPQNRNIFLSTVRLREAPLQTLRRVMRLFLCAGGGPGSMRCDGANGWRSCLTEADWHKVEYPGLSSRFGLEAYPLKKYFVTVTERSSITRVFGTSNDFRLFEIGVELRSSIDQAIEAFEIEKMNRRKREKSSTNTDERQPGLHVSTVDTLNLLTKDGRRNLVRMVSSLRSNATSELELLEKIENDIHEVISIGDSMNEHESLILCTSIVSRWLLQLGSDRSCLSWRPWLRHLSFDAILTYIALDGVSYMEKRDMYIMASSSLVTILFGIEIQRFCFDGSDICPSNQSLFIHNYAQYLLPRRNRGKAIERLLIDLTHAHRKLHRSRSKNPTPLDLSSIQAFCRLLLRSTVTNSSIPFSSIRNLARRLKSPLVSTIDGLSNDEMGLLQLRLDNVSRSNEIESRDGYSDWTPKTDVAVANALPNGQDESGNKRCAFVGWESNDNYPTNTRSLNVEELALEEYNSGRLPCTIDNKCGDNKSVPNNGGWQGWHDEGGHVRQLFRIIFLHSVLENPTDDGSIFLTPYQHSPHDLHVGYQLVENDGEGNKIIGFYERRKGIVEAFLSKLSQQTNQSLCDIVHDSIRARWDSHENDESRGKDATLLRDVADLRTLSMIAAGLGGVALSNMFRTLAFDYRHYSGGLPDLLLARARYCSTNQLVDLGDWIGEAFSKDSIDQENLNRNISMLADRDDDFLGCSKNVDSGHNKFKKRKQKIFVVPTFPSKLQLEHECESVKCDCMFVEVKSASDRLDARQEDWLNIIDTCADARVCKFFENKK